MAKNDKFELVLEEEFFNRGDRLTLNSHEVVEVLRKKYSRWWERLLNWLSGGRWFSTNPDHIVYIMEIID